MDNQPEIDRAWLRGAERERDLLARELHDTLCPSLAGLALLVQVMRRAKEAGREPALADIVRISEMLQVALEQSRGLIDAQLSTDNPGLPQALKRLAHLVSTAVACEFVGDASVRPGRSEMARLLYRIARESVQAIVRQAQATRITLALHQREKTVVLEVRYEGKPARDQSNAGLLEGDGLLHRLAATYGIQWEVDESAAGLAILRCTCPTEPAP